jgi:hypothetical protein
MAQMVNWPGADGFSWVDSGEGGLYAMLVVPSDDREDDPHCHIDVNVVMTAPDAPQSDVRDFGGPYDAREARSRAEAEEILRTSSSKVAYHWAIRAYSPDALSASVQAAIHIGSTSASLVHVHGGYFRVGYENLTTRGKLLYDTLKSAYDREPVILTFLDT